VSGAADAIHIFVERFIEHDADVSPGVRAREATQAEGQRKPEEGEEP
jgi:hypothetical protein